MTPARRDLPSGTVTFLFTDVEGSTKLFGNGRASEAVAALHRPGNGERRRLRSGAVAHEFTAEERRRGAQRTNEIRRERATRHRAATEEPVDLAEKLYFLQADKHLLVQAFNRLSRELCCSDCHAAAGMEPMQIMKRAGHSDFGTTQIYINLAGETFPQAAELLEERMLGQKSGQT